MAKIREVLNVPRWVYRSVVVPPQSRAYDPSSKVANDTPYKMRLVSLSFTAPFSGFTLIPEKSDTYAYLNSAAWARYLKVEIGKTGYSDQNLVAGSIAAICSQHYPKRQKGSALAVSHDLVLPKPYILPRNCGLEVKACNMAQVPEASVEGDSPDRRVGDLTVVAKGYRYDSREPVTLAGRTVMSLDPAMSVSMDSADLFNLGREDVVLTRLMLKHYNEYTAGDRDSLRMIDTSGTVVGYRINPTRGTLWMPNPSCIPIGNLCPFSRDTLSLQDDGPRAYVFPPNTYLYPQERLGIQLFNVAEEVAKNVNVCLHSILEVR